MPPGDHLQRCWTYDASARGIEDFRVKLRLLVDPTGIVRVARVAGPDAKRMERDPAFRALAERAIRAVLDPQCADNRPLKSDPNGGYREITIEFTP